MLNNKIKKASVLMSLLLIMTGCGTNLNTTVDTSDYNTNTSSTLSKSSDLKFNKVMETKLAEYNSLITKNTTSNQGVSNNALSTTMPMVGGVSPYARSTAPYISYFPGVGPFEEYTVIDFEEAKTAGFSGTYLDTLNKIVKPVLKGLGNDSRMVSSNGSSDSAGINKSEEATQPSVAEISPVPYNTNYQQYQWQFTYVSSAKKEVYSIFVSTKETLVLRQKWGIKDLSPNDIKIDSNSAIKIISDAIVNKNYIEPDNGQNYVSSGTETLYEIPKDTTWYLYLEKEKGKLIWNINMNILNYYPVPMPLYDPAVTSNNSQVKPAYPTQPEYWYSGGYARIDAESGAIIDLNRPTRYKNVQPLVYPEVGQTTTGSAGVAVSGESPDKPVN